MTQKTSSEAALPRAYAQRFPLQICLICPRTVRTETVTAYLTTTHTITFTSRSTYTQRVTLLNTYTVTKMVTSHSTITASTICSTLASSFIPTYHHTGTNQNTIVIHTTNGPIPIMTPVLETSSCVTLILSTSFASVHVQPSSRPSSKPYDRPGSSGTSATPLGVVIGGIVGGIVFVAALLVTMVVLAVIVHKRQKGVHRQHQPR